MLDFLLKTDRPHPTLKRFRFSADTAPSTTQSEDEIRGSVCTQFTTHMEGMTPPPHYLKHIEELVETRGLKILLKIHWKLKWIFLSIKIPIKS